MPPQIEVELMKLMFCRNINWTVDCPTPRGVTLYITLGGQLLRKFGESASAEGSKQRLQKARSLSRLGVWGSVVSSPLGSRAEPQKPTRFLTFYAKMKYILDMLISYF